MTNVLHIGGPKDGQWKAYPVEDLPYLDYAEYDKATGETKTKHYWRRLLQLGQEAIYVYVWDDAQKPLEKLAIGYKPQEASK